MSVRLPARRVRRLNWRRRFHQPIKAPMAPLLPGRFSHQHRTNRSRGHGVAPGCRTAVPAPMLWLASASDSKANPPLHSARQALRRRAALSLLTSARFMCAGRCCGPRSKLLQHGPVQREIAGREQPVGREHPVSRDSGAPRKTNFFTDCAGSSRQAPLTTWVVEIARTWAICTRARHVGRDQGSHAGDRCLSQTLAANDRTGAAFEHRDNGRGTERFCRALVSNSSRL